MSKELEALKRIRQETCPCTYNNDFDKEKCCDIIETALKALEIIKEKEVAVFFLNKSRDVDDYNHILKTYGTNQELTQEEYDLLKEVLL